jgi:zinc carboxypeptidase
MPRILLLLALIAPGLATAEPISYFLDDADEAFDPAVPTPASVIGHEVGEYHVTHDRLLQYFQALAAASPRVSIEWTGRTHEGRPTFVVVITSAERMPQVDAVREAHLQDIEQGRVPATDAPLFLWLGYSVHGNEASGSNAALVVAYRLAASRSPEVDAFLDGAVILMEPSVNPDGLQRFASWVDANRSAHPSPDIADREHQEPWPGGRTNHYWFDLNRDWLLLQHPESRARVAAFYRWRPHVVTDHHEMGGDATFFFQPGVPERRHPLTPEDNVTLTAAIAGAHAAAFDARGQLYYSGEDFDDFYYGKGSTYPDVNGSIGILFEQASTRGHMRDSDHGQFSFADAIRNHVSMSFSTLSGALANREALADYMVRFYSQLPSGGPAAYLFSDIEGSGRGRALVELLRQHQIEVQVLGEDAQLDGRTLAAGSTWVVRTAQQQGRLVRAVLEVRDEFPDQVFYDVSSWTLPLAYGLMRAELDSSQLRRLALDSTRDSAMDPASAASRPQPPAAGAYAYLLDWRAEMAPAALDRLLAAGVRVALATEPLTDGEVFPRGTLVVPMGHQELPVAAVMAALDAAAALGVSVVPLGSGALEGVDLGSPTLRPLSAPRVLLVTGSGVSSYEAGEVWHLLDQRLGIGLTRVEQQRLAGIDLQRYSHLILVDGVYSDLDDQVDGLRSWIEAGGVLIAQKGAIDWLVERELLAGPEGAEPGSDAAIERRSYAGRDDDAAVDLIGGAIFQVEVDLTHPLAFGIQRPQIAVFRNHTRFREPLADAYANVAVYSESPWLSGYVSERNLEALAGTMAVGTVAVGRGRLILLTDDGQFRGFWRGTERFMLNALFFASAID